MIKIVAFTEYDGRTIGLLDDDYSPRYQSGFVRKTPEEKKQTHKRWQQKRYRFYRERILDKREKEKQVKLKRQAYYQRNKERINQYAMKYYLDHLEKVLKRNKDYKARKKGGFVI